MEYKCRIICSPIFRPVSGRAAPASRASVAREPYKCPTKALRHTPQQASGGSAVRAARRERNRKTNIAPHYSPITEYFSYICLHQE